MLHQNTIGYLDRRNLRRIRELGGRPKRGLLLTGPPGNGKTSACRWLRNECLRLGLEHQEVGPDAYQPARQSCNPVQAVRDLFTVNRRGVIFFDDMDIALRDRNTVKETDDQAVFLARSMASRCTRAWFTSSRRTARSTSSTQLSSARAHRPRPALQRPNGRTPPQIDRALASGRPSRHRSGSSDRGNH